MDCGDIVTTGIESLGLSLQYPEKKVAGLCRYYSELVKWNRTINLVGRNSMEQILETHFLDSLTLMPLIAQPENEVLMDIGSGGGFPGLVLKTVLPGLSVTLVEPRRKRVSFLKHVIRTLDLEGIQIIPERLDRDHPRSDILGRYSLITSRAFASTPEFVQLAGPYCRPGGRIVCMKGPKGKEEAHGWQTNPLSHHFKLDDTRTINLPFSRACRIILSFTKISDQPQP